MSPRHPVTWSSLKRLLPYAALLAVWALWFWRFAALNPADRLTYPAGDFTMQFGVFRDIAYRALAAGRFPLWADCLYSGYPFHADPQSQIFYPPVWLVFGVLRLGGWGHFPIEALVAEVAFHYLLTSLFLFLFLSSLSLRRSAAILGSLVFTYGGYLTSYPPLQTAVLEVSTWLPLALLFAGRLADTRRARHLALTALALAIAFFAGHPQTFVYVALITLAYFTFRARLVGWKFAAFASGAAALVALTAALAAAQLLPSLQFVLNSDRASVSFAEASGGFAFVDVLQFLLTGFVSRWHPLYVGILPLGLAAFAIARSKNREVGFWAAAALVSLVLSFGTKAAAFDAAYWLIPGLRFFRGPERLALGVSFALAALAALGAHHLFGPLARCDRHSRARLIRIGAVLFGGAFALLGVSHILSRLGLDPSDWQRFPDRAGVLTLGVGLALTALIVRARVPSLRAWLPALCVSAAVLDLFAANRPMNVIPPADAYPSNAALAPVLVESGFFRVQDDFQLPGHAGCVYGYRAVEGVTPYRVASYAQFFDRAPESVRQQLLGVRFVVTWQQEYLNSPLAPQEAASAPSAPGAPNASGITKTFELTANAPRRAFLVHAVDVAPTTDSVFAALSDPNFDPFAIVILSQSTEVSPGAGGDSVAVESDVPGHVRLRTDSESAAVFVLSESYFPGWQATVDGRATAVLRADGALMAVSLPAGEHEIEFIYRPAPLLWGGIVSVIALLLAIIFLLPTSDFQLPK